MSWLDSTEEKLYPGLPASPWPMIIVVIITLGILYFDSTQGYSTNPVILFSIPMIYLILLTGTVGLDSMLKELGFWINNAWEFVVIAIGSVITFFLGMRLAEFAATKANSLISVYPFNMASTAQVNSFTWQLLSLSPNYSFVLYSVVATFEECYAFIFGKTFANFIYTKLGVKNRVVAEVVGFLVGRAAWAALHWFSYGGFSHPILYFNAFVLGTLFFFSSWIVGLIADLNVGVADIIKEHPTVVIPFAIFVAIAFHWGFNYGLARLMIVTVKVATTGAP
jgi:hypothetical protein